MKVQRKDDMHIDAFGVPCGNHTRFYWNSLENTKSSNQPGWQPELVSGVLSLCPVLFNRDASVWRLFLCSAALVAGLGEKPILRHLQLSWLSSAIVGRDCLQKPGRTLTWNLTITPDAQKTLSTVGQEPHRKLPVSSKSRSLGIPDPEIVGLPVPSLSTGGWECSSGPVPSAFLHVSALNLFIC